MHHYTYRITNIKTNEFYIGVRSCTCNIEDDPYMGSSSIWNKKFILENKDFLTKSIINEFGSREEANNDERELLIANEGNKLCVNRFFGKMPNLQGVKQSEEWINKRKLFGIANGMYGKHHTPESKRKIGQASKNRIVSEETRKKIGDFNRFKTLSSESRKKISNANSKIRLFIDTRSDTCFCGTISEFIDEFPSECFHYDAIKKAAEKGYLYKKIYKVITIEAVKNRKSDENGESLIEDNSVGSIETANDQQNTICQERPTSIIDDDIV